MSQPVWVGLACKDPEKGELLELGRMREALKAVSSGGSGPRCAYSAEASLKGDANPACMGDLGGAAGRRWGGSGTLCRASS